MMRNIVFGGFVAVAGVAAITLLSKDKTFAELSFLCDDGLTGTISVMPPSGDEVLKPSVAALCAGETIKVAYQAGQAIKVVYSSGDAQVMGVYDGNSGVIAEPNQYSLILELRGSPAQILLYNI